MIDDKERYSYQSSDAIGMLLDGLDPPPTHLDSRDICSKVSWTGLRVQHPSRPKLLPVRLAAKRDFKAAIQNLFSLDEFSSKALQLLAVLKGNYIVVLTAAISVDE